MTEAATGALQDGDATGDQSLLGPVLSARQINLRNRMARVILRIIQGAPDGISRTHLGVQVRPYGPEWTDVIDVLIDMGYVNEESQIVRPRGKNRRAVIIYRLPEDRAASSLDFDAMDADELAHALSLVWRADYVPTHLQTGPASRAAGVQAPKEGPSRSAVKSAPRERREAKGKTGAPAAASA